MSDGFYSESELLAIASPLRLGLDELPCDSLGCDASARQLVPGCALCDACWQECLGDDGRYRIDFQDLVGGEEWRRARRELYVERLRELGPQRRNARDEEALDGIAARRVELELAILSGVVEDIEP